MFQTHMVSGDGNCLFSSLEIILKGENKPNYRANIFREHVAYSVLDEKNPIANAAIKQWFEIVSQPELDTETRIMLIHASQVYDTTLDSWPISKSSRHKLYRNMLQPHMYWGDEYALTILENILQIRIFIINDQHHLRDNQSNHWDRDSKINYRPSHFCFVSLRLRHYEPVSFRGKFLFTAQDINDFPEAVAQTLHTYKLY